MNATPERSPAGAPATKGLRILRSGLVTRNRQGSGWNVRSESGNGTYSVRLLEGAWTCTCPAFSVDASCKHITACRLLTGETPAEPPRVDASRKTYSQDWSAYDLGQTQEVRLVQQLLADLVAAIPEPAKLQGVGGRPPLPVRDQVFATLLKVWSGRSGRRATGFTQAAAKDELLSTVPGRMSVQRVLNRSDLSLTLNNLLSLSALPLVGLEEGGAVAPDSTGIQTTSFGAWRETKHGERRERHWLKVHAIVGTKTHVIIRAVVGEENSGDSPQFAPLLRSTLDAGFRPSSVVADKGYLSYANYRLAGDLGIEAYIPFKSSSMSRRRSHGSPGTWRRAFHLFQANREEFDRSYHRRSNVEAVFSALKRKFGENIRSRTKVAQMNEVLCKLIAYNLTVLVHEMFENGIAPQFQREGGRGSSG